MGNRSLFVEPTNDLPRRLEADGPSAGIKPPCETLRFGRLVLAALIRIHRIVPERSDDLRSGPLERHRSAIRWLIHPQRVLANGERPHGLLVELHVEQIEDVPSDEEPVLLSGNRVEDPVKDLRRAKYVPELRTTLHPEIF